jgi:hypothetical protein
LALFSPVQLPESTKINACRGALLRGLSDIIWMSAIVDGGFSLGVGLAFVSWLAKSARAQVRVERRRIAEVAR